MLDVITVVDDGDDARRAPQGVMLAVFINFWKPSEQMIFWE